MVLFSRKNGKRTHVHAFCLGAVVEEKAYSRRYKKLTHIEGVCGGAVEDEGTEERVAAGMDFLQCVMAGEQDLAYLAIGTCVAEADNAMEVAAARIRKYPLG